MRNRLVFSTLLGLFALFFAASAFAQATRTWVSGVGDDVNPCSRTAPCKTFAGAISKTAAGGIIDVLDPGGFGAVTVTKSITIESVGNVGSILSSGTQGVVINALSTDTVVLRGLSIDGAGSTLGTNGVRVISAGKLVVENCTIQNYSSYGIDFEPNANSTLTVDNTTINNIGGTAIFVQATSASVTAKANITSAHFFNDANGVQVSLGVATLKNSVLSNTAGYGVRAYGTGSRVTLDDVVVSDGTGTGVYAFGTGNSIYMSRTTVTNNATGVGTFGGSITSYGDNRIFGNTSDGAVTSKIAEQ